MKRHIATMIVLMLSISAFAQSKAERDYTTLKGLSFGIGIPFECRDLPGAGLTLNIGYDKTYPINNHFAMGFYLTGGGGFWGEYKKDGEDDYLHGVFRLTAGVMMQIGNQNNKPYLLGIAPCTGFGLYDLDLVLPVEVRFGKYITDRWYVMGELTYHASLADETVCIEPAIRIGYNFGRKVRKVKK